MPSCITIDKPVITELAALQNIVSNTWIDSASKMFSYAKSTEHKIALYKIADSKLNIISAVRANNHKAMVPFVLASNSWHCQFDQITDFFTSAISSFKTDYILIQNQIKNLGLKCVLVPEIRLKHVKLMRKGKHYIFGHSNNYNIDYDAMQRFYVQPRRLKNKAPSPPQPVHVYYDKDLIQAIVEIHIHAIMPRKDYEVFKNASRRLRLDRPNPIDIHVEGKRNVYIDPTKSELAEYCTKFNIVAPESDIRFNRFMQDVPASTPEKMRMRLKWMELLSPYHNFVGKDDAIYAIQRKIRRKIKKLQQELHEQQQNQRWLMVLREKHKKEQEIAAKKKAITNSLLVAWTTRKNKEKLDTSQFYNINTGPRRKRRAWWEKSIITLPILHNGISRHGNDPPRTLAAYN
jgi:hypothetical protein